MHKKFIVCNTFNVTITFAEWNCYFLLLLLLPLNSIQKYFNGFDVSHLIMVKIKLFLHVKFFLHTIFRGSTSHTFPLLFDEIEIDVIMIIINNVFSHLLFILEMLFITIRWFDWNLKQMILHINTERSTSYLLENLSFYISCRVCSNEGK